MYPCKTLLSCSSTHCLFQRPNLTRKKLEEVIAAIFVIGSIVAISLSLIGAAGLSSGWMEAGVLTSRAIVLITGMGVLVVLSAAALKRCIGHHTESAGSIPSVKESQQDTDPVQSSVKTSLPLGHKDTNQIEVFGKAAYLQEGIEIKEQEPPLPKIDTANWPNFNPDKYAWVWVSKSLTYDHLIADKAKINTELDSFHQNDKQLSSFGWKLISRELLGAHTTSPEHPSSYCEDCETTANTFLWSKGEKNDFRVANHSVDATVPLAYKNARRPYALEALVMCRLHIAKGEGYTTCVEREGAKCFNIHGDLQYRCITAALSNTMKDVPFLHLIGDRTEGNHEDHIGSLLVMEF